MSITSGNEGVVRGRVSDQTTSKQLLLLRTPGGPGSLAGSEDREAAVTAGTRTVRVGPIVLHATGKMPLHEKLPPKPPTGIGWPPGP